MTPFMADGISVYMAPDLVEQLKPLGGVVIDFVDYGPDQRGFTITTKVKPGGGDCSSGCGSGGCGEEPEA